MPKRLRTSLGALALASAFLAHAAQAAPLEQDVTVTTVDHVAIRGTFYAVLSTPPKTRAPAFCSSICAGQMQIEPTGPL